jgi:hypothetical protein
VSTNTEGVARGCYGKSADPAAPENAGSPEFQAGFKVGLVKDGSRDGLAIIEREYIRRGLPQDGTLEREAFNEWKRGMWAGLFTRLDNEIETERAEQ